MTPSLAGIWPRFYVLSTDFWNDATPWPRMGEWEILELKNGLETFVPVLHCGEINGGPCQEPEGFNPGAGYTVSRGQFHQVGVEIDRSMCSKQEDSECWREETVTWLFENEPRYRVRGGDLGDKDAWKRLFHQKVFMGLSVGVGGSRVSQPNNDTVEGLSAGMEIDYVGVWESKYP
jgi:hypothetical protein